MKKLWQSLIAELRRLNSARIDRTTLAKLPPLEKSKAVKAALHSHHANPNRCC